MITKSTSSPRKKSNTTRTSALALISSRRYTICISIDAHRNSHQRRRKKLLNCWWKTTLASVLNMSNFHRHDKIVTEQHSYTKYVWLQSVNTTASVEFWHSELLHWLGHSLIPRMQNQDDSWLRSEHLTVSFSAYLNNVTTSRLTFHIIHDVQSGAPLTFPPSSVKVDSPPKSYQLQTIVVTVRRYGCTSVTYQRQYMQIASRQTPNIVDRSPFHCPVSDWRIKKRNLHASTLPLTGITTVNQTVPV